MLRETLVALIGATLGSGCATTAPRIPEADRSAGAVRGVDGPTPHVRTQLQSPIHVGAVDGAGHRPARLDVGAFFARFERSAGPMDQLALMIEVKGGDVPALLRSSRQLLLEVDGELFVGEPGISANSFRVDLVGDEPRATVVIPVAPELLARLADAEVVRGRLGLWAAFTLPPRCRTRFRDLLRALPEGATSSTLRSSVLRRVTETDFD
ncbi:MAG: hypothetical protein RLN75_05745 [Longimicrobiales bacterium]